MDGRIPQPSDRRVVTRQDSRQEPVYRQADEPQRPQEPLQSSRRATDVKSPKKGTPRKGLLVTLPIILGIIVLAIAGWLVWTNTKGGETGIDASKYQTVYLMNGQIYFGKLTPLGDSRYKLTNVYYLQTQTTDTDLEKSSDTSNDTANNAQLIRLSNAIYGPDDEMIISKDQVLYFQNLKADGKAAQLIENDK